MLYENSPAYTDASKTTAIFSFQMDFIHIITPTLSNRPPNRSTSRSQVLKKRWKQ